MKLITRTLQALFAFLAIFSTLHANAQSVEPIRSADSVDQFIIYSGSLDQGPWGNLEWVYGSVVDRGKRYLDMTPWLDTMSMNGLSLGFCDYEYFDQYKHIEGAIPVDTARRGRRIGANYTHDKFPFVIQKPVKFSNGLINASYLRIEAERHSAKSSLIEEYPGFVEAPGLTGADYKDTKASNAGWLKTYHSGDTAVNCVRLRGAQHSAGIFDSSLWRYDYLGDTIVDGASGKDSTYYYWRMSGSRGLNKILDLALNS